MIERKDRRRGSREAKTGDDLLRNAMKHPGVADMMTVYGQHENVMERTAPYLAAMRDRVILLISTSSQE